MEAVREDPVRVENSPLFRDRAFRRAVEAVREETVCDTAKLVDPVRVEYAAAFVCSEEVTMEDPVKVE